MYIYILIYNHHSSKEGGRTQNVSYIFQDVFEGALENVSLHFEGILRTLPTKTAPGGRSATNFTFKGGPKKCSLHFGMVPLKSGLKGVAIIYNLISHETHPFSKRTVWINYSRFQDTKKMAY